MKITSSAVSMQPIDQLCTQMAKELRSVLQPVVAQMIDAMGIPEKYKPSAEACLYSEILNRFGHAFMADVINTTDSTTDSTPTSIPIPTSTSRSIH